MRAHGAPKEIDLDVPTHPRPDQPGAGPPPPTGPVQVEPTGPATAATTPEPARGGAAPSRGPDGVVAMLRRWLARPVAPALLLVLVCALSVGARIYHLDTPSESTAASGFVFDEKYYVNAARVIAHAPMPSGDTYAPAGNGTAPYGSDPNAEHPQGGKLVIAAGIKMFGDNGYGWRIGAVVFGTLAIVALFGLVRALGGSEWLALGAAALMAFENLELVHARIGVLDVYALPFMLFGATLWLRRRYALAGAVIAAGTCMKLFGGYALFAVLLFEMLGLLRWLWDRRGSAEVHRFIHRFVPLVLGAVVVAGGLYLVARGAGAAAALLGAVGLLAAAVVMFPAAEAASGIRGHLAHPVARMSGGIVVFAAVLLAGLGVMDHFVPAWSGGRQISVDWQPWTHLQFLYDYGRNLRSPDGPKGIASYPWQFWFDVEAANYYTYNTFVMTDGKTTAINTVIAYQGIVNPVLLAMAFPALGASVWLAIRRRDNMSFLIIAWVLATWIPPFVASALDQRTVYLYYMVVILPAIFVATARLLGDRRVPRVVLGIWIGLFASAFVILYPFRDWGYLTSFLGA